MAPAPDPCYGRGDVRLPRVVASVALIVALALIVVPGSVGSRTPSPDPPLDARLLQPVELARPLDGTPVTAPTLDPAYRSNGALDTGDTLVEPAPAPEAQVRIDADSPAAPVRIVAIATPRPAPTAPPGDGPAPAPPPPDPGGGWHYDPDVSWYGPGFYGNRTACGQTYSQTILGVAHKSLPCGTQITFRNPANGRVITVPVIDRGPYIAGRNWDLSRAACVALAHCYTGPLQWR